MSDSASKTPTLVSELFGASVGFRFGVTLRRICGALLVAAALLLLVRRLGGAFVHPPSFGTGLIAIASAVLIATVYRLLLRRFGPPVVGDPDGDTALPIRLQRLLLLEDLVLWYLPTAALPAIAASLSLPGTGTAALGAIWLTLVAAEAMWLGSRFAPEYLERSSDRKPTIDRNPPFVAAAPVFESGEAEAAESEFDEDAEVSQSWRRFTEADGSDVVEGFVRVSFAAGGRQEAIHLSFCPPFERTPTLEAEPFDDVDISLISATVLPYAARIDARLAEPAAEPTIVKIAIRAAAEKS